MIQINAHDEINTVFFTGDGKELFSGGDEGMLRRWRADDGAEVSQPIEPEGAQIYSATLSPDNRWLVCGLRRFNDKDRRTNVRVYDAQTNKQVLDVSGHSDAVFSVDVSPDSTKFATGSAERSVFIWNLKTGEKLVGPLQHEGWVVAVRFSPDGERLATATAENQDSKSVRIYDSKNGQQLLDVPCRMSDCIAASLAWVSGGHQLYVGSYGVFRLLDTSSGAQLGEWTAPGGGRSLSIVLSRRQTFAAVAAFKTLSFWDLSTHTQIGSVITNGNSIWSIAISPDDKLIAIGDKDGKVTIRNLCDLLPLSYLADTCSNDRPTISPSLSETTTASTTTTTTTTTTTIPFMRINDVVCKSWKKGNLARVEELLTEDISRSANHPYALANRALVRTRTGNRGAIEDAQRSIGIQRSAVGFIALAMARLRNGEHDSVLSAFDLVFSDGLATEHNQLLLIKAIILFESGKRDDAISRVDDLITMVYDKSVYVAVLTQMCVLFASVALKEGDHLRAIELLKRAQRTPAPRMAPHLIVISLIFGWDFDELVPAIQHHTEQCIKVHEEIGDKAMKTRYPEDAVSQYSAALSLGPSNRAALLVKRSKAYGKSKMWTVALEDADEAIKADPSNPWGYERRHAALHATQKFGDAVDAFTCMLSTIEQSPDQDVRRLAKKYISPSKSEAAIDNIARGVFKICPFVMIDVQSGRLCDVQERVRTFKSDSKFKELVSSMTEALDETRIMQTVTEYFQYVMLSHFWQGKEPSYQDVNAVESVWNLDSSPLNEKLKGFCNVVRADGYRWAWSDTCCIDRTISTILNQSLMMMYKWYEASAATLVHLATADSQSMLGALTDSLWMTRAWTAQEVLAAKVVRFYDRNWKPYLGDTRTNHKESPEIMQELARAIGIPTQTIAAFSPDHLSVREKLRVASTRNATLEEDVAYSLIGIFKSDIRPNYGEGDAALGHLLEEIVARGGVTALAWAGQSSSYNSCLPANLAVYSRPPGTCTAIDAPRMAERVEELRNSISGSDAIPIHDRVTRLPPARFANRRLHLPCIVFGVRKLGVNELGSGQGNRYRAQVPGIGYVEFQSSDKLSLSEPRKLVLVHPWIRELRDPLDGFVWGSEDEDEDEDEDDSDRETEAVSAPSSPLQEAPSAPTDDLTRALRLIARLQEPFHVLLLEQQPDGEFKRVAAEHEIVVPGIEPKIDFSKDLRVDVVEIV